jgi:anti-sigma regulatory factor (Ser/Thr protein kinase)
MQEPTRRLSREILLKLELQSNPQLLCVVRAAVQRLAEVFGFSAQGRRSVTRAVDEALTNIIRHSYRGLLDQPVAIYFRQVRRRIDRGADWGLEIQIWDRGLKFDPAKVPVRQLKKIRPGGLGLQFIRKAVDSVEYTRVGRSNRLRLVKYLPGPSRLIEGENCGADFRSANRHNHNI